MEQEIWKDIIGYECLYQVSNLGRVKSLDMKLPYKRHNNTTFRIRKGKILTPATMKNGIVVKEWKSASQVFRELGYLQQNIGKVALGKRKSAYGYQWKYL